MTPNAMQFITPLTLQTLSGHHVKSDLFSPESEADIDHIRLARWPDYVLVAPASANCLAKLVHGLADDFLSTLLLATTAPIIVAPAMNQAMWTNPATQHNIDLLKQRKITIIGPDSGSQACGETGPGRLVELSKLTAFFKTAGVSEQLQVLAQQKVMITAGPTQEAIDPVRFLSNHSSGKMGYALARAAIDAGAQVTLISGPVKLDRPAGLAEFIPVTSAAEMHDAVMTNLPEQAIFIGAAAVADYSPKHVSSQKIKKNSSNDCLTLQLEKNPDILAAAAKHVPFSVGFAAETEHLIAHAEKKLSQKNLDMICANAVNEADIGFNSDDNALLILQPNQEIISLPKMSKIKIAEQIIQHIASSYKNKTELK